MECYREKKEDVYMTLVLGAIMVAVGLVLIVTSGNK
jgi:hypothetical protein